MGVTCVRGGFTCGVWLDTCDWDQFTCGVDVFTCETELFGRLDMHLAFRLGKKLPYLVLLAVGRGLLAFGVDLLAFGIGYFLLKKGCPHSGILPY